MPTLIVGVWFFALGSRFNNVDGAPGGFTQLAELPVHTLKLCNGNDGIFAE